MQEREQHEAGQRLRAERPDEQEHRLEVEQDEDDRDRVVLDRDRLDVAACSTGVAPHSNGSSFSAEATGFGPSSRLSTSVTATKPRIATR